MKNGPVGTSNLKTKILESLESYRQSRPTITNWSVYQKADGVIETDWYRDHKGEVILKIKINPNVKPVEILVLQKIGWLLFFSKETPDSEWAQKTKQRLAALIPQSY